MSTNEASKSLFSGKYGELIKTLIISTFGAFIGSYLSYFFWTRQHKAETLDKYRIEATEVFKTVSTQLDGQIYSMQNLVGMMKAHDTSAYMRKQWDTFQSYGSEYNTHRNQNRALLDWYFGKSVRDDFANSHRGDSGYALYDQMEFARKEVRVLYENYVKDGAGAKHWNDSVFVKVENDLSILGGHIFSLDAAMIRAIKDGKVGSFCQDRDASPK